MPATNRDPHNLSELARVIALGVRIQRRQALGKGTKRLEARVDQIRARAEERENARRKK